MSTTRLRLPTTRCCVAGPKSASRMPLSHAVPGVETTWLTGMVSARSARKRKSSTAVNLFVAISFAFDAGIISFTSGMRRVAGNGGTHDSPIFAVRRLASDRWELVGPDEDPRDLGWEGISPTSTRGSAIRCCRRNRGVRRLPYRAAAAPQSYYLS
jgi:hypothetical protein